MPRHQFRGRKRALAELPRLHPGIKYTATYFDASVHNPERLTLDVLQDGGRPRAPRRPCQQLPLPRRRRAGKDGDRSIRGLRDELTGELFDFSADVIVNTTGAWVDLTNEAMGSASAFMGGTKGSHIVLDHPELLAACNGREIFFEHTDGRIVLIYPMGDRVLVGTTDVDADMAEDAVCTEAEIDYFFDLIGHVFPDITVDREQIVYTFSGVRPLPQHDATQPGFVSRDYRIGERRPAGAAAAPPYSASSAESGPPSGPSPTSSGRGCCTMGRRETVSTVGKPIGGGRHPAQRGTPARMGRGARPRRRGAPRPCAAQPVRHPGDRGARVDQRGRIRPSARGGAALQRRGDRIPRPPRGRGAPQRPGAPPHQPGVHRFAHASTARPLADIAATALGWDPDERQAQVDATIELLRTRHGVDLRTREPAGRLGAGVTMPITCWRSTRARPARAASSSTATAQIVARRQREHGRSSRGPAGSSTTRSRSGAHARGDRRGARRRRARRRATSPRSASPTSARRPSCGTATPGEPVLQRDRLAGHAHADAIVASSPADGGVDRFAPATGLPLGDLLLRPEDRVDPRQRRRRRASAPRRASCCSARSTPG